MQLGHEGTHTRAPFAGGFEELLLGTFDIDLQEIDNADSGPIEQFRQRDSLDVSNTRLDDTGHPWNPPRRESAATRLANYRNGKHLRPDAIS